MKPRGDNLLSDLTNLFPVAVSAVIADQAMFTATIYPEEEESIAAAVPKRRREFAAGRSAAREALAVLGCLSVPIPIRPDRSPDWPPDFVGSISHCEGCCCAVVARASDTLAIGVDVEVARPLPAGVTDMVFDENEQAWLRELSVRSELPYDTIGFSAKEAFYKCQFTLMRRFLNFHDVRLALDIGVSETAGSFEVVVKDPHHIASSHIQGRWRVRNGLIICGATVVPPAGQ
jgi:4'-phosphopantetheinyl transferase EntD